MDNKNPNMPYKRWFNSLECWQKDLFNELLANDLSVEELEEYFQSYIDGTKPLNEIMPKIDLGLPDINSVKNIVSIEDISNVGAINSEEIIFSEDASISLVFGNNGSGKSTFINLMKNVCGARGSKEVLGDIFNEGESPSATIRYKTNEEKQFRWHKGNPCLGLNGLQFFDSDYYRVYSNSKAEIILEPELFATLRKMVNTFNIFKEIIQKEIYDLENRITIPTIFDKSLTYTEFHNAENVEEVIDLKKRMTWNQEDQLTLDNIKTVLSNTNPKLEMGQIEIQIQHLNSIAINMRKWYDSLSDCKRGELIKQKHKCQDLKLAIKQAEKGFENNCLDGTGNEAWKILWNSAKNYSNEHAYSDNQFPYLGEGACCPLCQQPLLDNAKKLFMSFQNYLTSEIESNLFDADFALKKMIPEDIPEWIIIHSHMIEANVSKSIIDGIYIFYTRLNDRLNEMKDKDNVEAKTSLLPLIYFEAFIKNKIFSLESTKENLSQSMNHRETMEKQEKDLGARDWFFENISVYSNKIKIITLEKFKTKTDTTSLSRFKTNMSNILITDRFADQFKKELKSIGATRIKVELKSFTISGITGHKIVLRGANSDVPFNNILSEGERRAVSFAAFVSETIINSKDSPLIFDDPTNSMDSEYEEKIVKRLIELSFDRQVIIFTHRIPMATMLFTLKERQSVKCIRLLSEPVGAVSSDKSFIIDNVSKNLNMLISEAKNIKNCTPDIVEKSKLVLVTKMRKLIEQLIEDVLFDKIIKRFRRDVHSGRLRRIAAIEEYDILFVDKLMSKYSTYVHPQPSDTPETDSFKDDIIEDLNEIRKFVDNCNRKKKEKEKSFNPTISS